MKKSKVVNLVLVSTLFASSTAIAQNIEKNSVLKPDTVSEYKPIKDDGETENSDDEAESTSNSTNTDTPYTQTIDTIPGNDSEYEIVTKTVYHNGRSTTIIRYVNPHSYIITGSSVVSIHHSTANHSSKYTTITSNGGNSSNASNLKSRRYTNYTSNGRTNKKASNYNGGGTSRNTNEASNRRPTRYSGTTLSSHSEGNSSRSVSRGGFGSSSHHSSASS